MRPVQTRQQREGEGKYAQEMCPVQTRQPREEEEKMCPIQTRPQRGRQEEAALSVIHITT